MERNHKTKKDNSFWRFAEAVTSAWTADRGLFTDSLPALPQKIASLVKNNADAARVPSMLVNAAEVLLLRNWIVKPTNVCKMGKKERIA